MTADKLLEVQHLKQYFQMPNHLKVRAVDDISFFVKKGEIFGLVGESGCGKSTLARCLAGIYRPTEGRIFYENIPVSGKGADRAGQKKRQREVQIIFQDCAAALNPRMRIEQIVTEPLRIQRTGGNSSQRRRRFEEALEQVELPASLGLKYPGELSGGQRQRVAIARSLMLEPKLVIADEPTAALDPLIQAQIMALFGRLQREKHFTFFLIGHDLSLIRLLSDRVGVMLKGRLVELGPVKEVFDHPLHPYTRSLLSAVHIPDPVIERGRRLVEYDRKVPLGKKMKEMSPGHFVLETGFSGEEQV